MPPVAHAVLLPVLWPLGTTAPVYRRPWATYTLMGLNLLAAAGAWFFPDLLFDRFVLDTHPVFYQYLSYAFLHEGTLLGLGHLALNMIFLWIFGAALESRMGALGIFAIYAAAAIAGAVTHRLAPGAGALCGASAAVYGVIGAYIILFPYSSVKCLFSLLLIVFPLYTRVINILAVIFIVAFWSLNWLITYLAIYTGLIDDTQLIPDTAHLGGLLIGAAVTAGIYGFHAFTRAAWEEREAERAVEQKLAQKVQEKDPFDLPDTVKPEAPARPAEAPASGAPGRPRPRSPRHIALAQAVDLGEEGEALAHWADLAASEPGACLDPERQLKLGRLLIQAQMNELALGALERLLAIHPTSKATPDAQFELARLLIQLHQDPIRASVLLKGFILTAPDAEREAQAQALLAQIQSPSQPAPARRLNGTRRQDDAALGADLESEDTGKLLRAAKPANSAARLASIKQSTRGKQPETMANGAVQLGIDDTATLIAALTPDDDDTRAAMADTGEDTDPGLAGAVNQNAGWSLSSPVDFGLDESSAESRAETARRGAIWREQSTTGTAGSTTDSPSDGGTMPTPHYAVLLPPDRPIELPVLIDTLGPILDLTPEATHHAIICRRGVLLDSLGAEEAQVRAAAFARAGQAVLIANQDYQDDFPKPQEVLSYKLNGGLVQLRTFTTTGAFAWDEILCIGAGQVTLAPGTPSRAVIDLFFNRPRVRLRLWENVLLMPDWPDLDEQARFREVARLISERAERAIHTRAFDAWLQTAGALRPRRQFHNLIDYENDLRWHRLAYLAPHQMVEAREG